MGAAGLDPAAPIIRTTMNFRKVHTMSADQLATTDSTLTEHGAGFSMGGLWLAINRWRRSRPFWGCLILAFGGWSVMKPMVGASFQMVVHMGMRGASPYILGGGMILAAVVALFMPAQRHFPAIMALVFAVLSLPFANLGGWIIGMVLGIVGAGLVFAWTPYSDKQLARFAEKDERRAVCRADKLSN